MQHFALLLTGFFFFLFAPFHQVYAQKQDILHPQQNFSKGMVIAIEKESASSQLVTVRLLDGKEKDKVVTIPHGKMYTISEAQKVKPGDEVIVNKVTNPDGKSQYVIFDLYRTSRILFMFAAFCLLVIFLTGRRGIGALLGMTLSLIVIIGFIVPQILNGHNPLFISILGSLVIMVASIFLAHGISKQTTVAVAATLCGLVLTGVFGTVFVGFLHLTGLGTEAAYSLQFGPLAINTQGLLLGGIIIGALGVLDDVTTTQSATIFALAKANKSFTFFDLVEKGFAVGKEHILSLVNTLVLAYAGASIAVFLYIVLTVQTHTLPLWVVINSPDLAEEIVRTLAGSFGLVMVVPITTVLAAYVCRKLQ